jgi:hypothetical protein
MKDITEVTQFIDSTPQEAAENIHSAPAFNIAPDIFKQNKAALKPELDKMSYPSEATPDVAEYMGQSPEHTALAIKDVEKLSYVEKVIKHVGNQVGRGGLKSLTDRRADLHFKEMWSPDQVTQDDQYKIEELKVEEQELAIPDLTFGEELPGLVVGALADVGSSVWKHSEKIAAATGAGAVIGSFGGVALGPIGVPAGAFAGAGAGLVAGTSLAIGVDSAKKQMALVYGEMGDLQMEDGKEIDHETKKYFATGVGIASGVISGFVGAKVARTLPFLNKFATPKLAAQFFQSPASKATAKILTDLGESMASGGVGESLDTSFEIISKELARNWDGTETGFINGAVAATQQLKAQSGEILKSGVVGGLTSGTMTAVPAPLAFAQAKNYFTPKYTLVEQVSRKSDIVPRALSPDGEALPPPSVIDDIVQVLQLDQSLDMVKKVLDTTEIKKLSPSETYKITKKVLDRGGFKEFFIDKEALTTWADNETKAADIRKIISVENEERASLNVPMSFDPVEVFKLTEKYPELTQLIQLKPEGPNTNQALELLDKRDKADLQRQELLAELGSPNLTPERKAEIETIQKQALETTEPSNDVFGEDDYLNQPTFTQAVEATLGPGVVQKYNDAQRKARETVVDNINETAEYEMNEIVDIQMEITREAEFEAQLARTENSPNIIIVDRFMQNAEAIPDYKGRFRTTSEMTEAHQKPGFSPYAIDPRTVPDDLKSYLKDPQLKSHKVFVKGGISLEDSARFMGLNNGSLLLKTLSQTPTREQVAKARTEARDPDLRRKLKESVNLNETAIIKAYEATAANHYAEMQFMKSQEWAATKFGIKTIALPLKRSQEFADRSRTVINNTTLGQLNANQYKVAERKSQRKAVKAILNNDVTAAFIAKEAATQNVYLAKDTHIAIATVNRNKRFIKRLLKKDRMRELQDAGNMSAAREILDIFNLDPSQKGTSEAGQYQKYLKKEVANGNLPLEIPSRLADIRESANEMTFEQHSKAVDVLRNMLHVSRMKNKLNKKFTEIKEVQTLEAHAEVLSEVASQSPQFDPSKTEVFEEKTKTEKFGETFRTTVTTLDRTQYLLLSADSDKLNGPWDQRVWQPIKAADAEKAKLTQSVQKDLLAAIKKFGEKEFKTMASDFVIVADFKDAKGLRYDRISKMNLFTMLLNFGNEGNINRLENFGVSKDVIFKAIETHLDSRHADLAQEFWNINKSLEPQVKQLELDTTGVEPKMVESKPFTFKGKEYQGGYYAIHYASDKSKAAAESAVGKAEMTKLDRLIQRFHARAMTDQGHLEARTGSDSYLSLDVSNFAYSLGQTIHDITHRKMLMDTSKLLTYPKIKDALVSVIGQEGYVTVMSTIEDVADSATNNQPDKTTGILMKLMRRGLEGFQTMAIAGKTSSVLIQAASLPFAINRMGLIKGSKHFALVAKKLATNPDLVTNGKLYEFAAEIHPDIRNVREDLEGDMVQNLLTVFEQKKNPVVASRDFIVDMCFSALGHADQLNKVVTVTTAYSQAINGDADGVPANNHAEAMRYASNIAELTQTHSNTRNLSPIQKNKNIKSMLLFYNDLNNIHNGHLMEYRLAKKKFQEFKDAASKKEMSRAGKLAGLGIGGLMGYTIMMMTVKTYIDAIQGRLELPESDDPEEYLEKFKSTFMESSVDLTIGTAPILRDIQFDTKVKWDTKIPVQTMITDAANATTGLIHMLPFVEEPVSKKEARAMVFTLGYLTKLPFGGIDKELDKPDYRDIPYEIESQFDQMSKSIKSFLKKNEGSSRVPKEFIDDLKQIQSEIEPQSNVVDIPKETLPAMAEMISGGNWRSYNPETGAAGTFQFTEKEWEEIQTAAPDLGLTENGRVSKDQTQQNEAMGWVNEKNARILKTGQLPANTDTLYAARILGPEAAITVLNSSDSEKLKTLVTPEVMKTYGFRNRMKVGEFKDWLTQKTLEAEAKVSDIDKNRN